MTTAEEGNIFYCKICDHTARKKSDWTRHLSTRKHTNSAKYNKKALKSAETDYSKKYTCICGKTYTHRASLYNHQKNCAVDRDVDRDVNRNSNNNDNNKEIFSIVETIIKENNDFKKIITDLIQTNNNLQKHIIDTCVNNFDNSTTNSTTNIHNTINKTFNLHLFLNEQCKDAMNINEFVETFKMQQLDLEAVGRTGYVDGISDIIIKRLNEMDVYKRPIHCSDAKREKIFVKDTNIWEQDNENMDKLRNVVKSISKKNSDMLTQWSNTHPAAHNIDSALNNTYMTMIIQAMGGKGELSDNENKIMKKIIKHVVIVKPE